MATNHSIGTTRNLSSQFIKLRNDARRARAPNTQEDKATAKLLGAALDGAGDLELGSPGISTTFAPSWVHKSEKIKTEMSILKDRLTKLKEYHTKALLVSFDTDGTGGSAQVDALTREIQLTFKRLDGEVRGMDKVAGGGDEDAQVRLQVQRQLAQALFKLSVDFRKEETRFLNKIEANKGLEAGSSIGLVEDDSGGRPDDPGFTDIQLMKVSQAETQIEERDEEIRKVVETIAELAQIMRDLSTLVVEQGSMLDRIDHNVQEVAMKVEQGVRELVKAETTQKNGRAMLCIIALIVMIVVMLIIVVLRKTI